MIYIMLFCVKMIVYFSEFYENFKNCKYFCKFIMSNEFFILWICYNCFVLNIISYFLINLNVYYYIW